MSEKQLLQWMLSNPNRLALVGSREAPDDILSLARRAGKAFCDAGYLGVSGEADGMDKAFHDGARLSRRYNEVKFVSFIPYNGFRSSATSPKLFHDPENNIYDASKYSNIDKASEIAMQARGSFAGLGRGGIAAQSRNPFQVLSPSLVDPVIRLFCWAIPVGKSGKVRGGTNTAVMIALANNIPVINLYRDEHRMKLEGWLNAKTD